MKRQSLKQCLESLLITTLKTCPVVEHLAILASLLKRLANFSSQVTLLLANANPFCETWFSPQPKVIPDSKECAKNHNYFLPQRRSVPVFPKSPNTNLLRVLWWGGLGKSHSATQITFGNSYAKRLFLHWMTLICIPHLEYAICIPDGPHRVRNYQYPRILHETISRWRLAHLHVTWRLSIMKMLRTWVHFFSTGGSLHRWENLRKLQEIFSLKVKAIQR